MTIEELLELKPYFPYERCELELMQDTVERFRPSHIFDWGTNIEASARAFYEFALTAQLETTVHTVELPDEIAALDPSHPGVVRGHYLVDRPIVQHQGDGVTVALVEYARAGSPLSVFFLDGDHLRESVFREVALIARFAPAAAMLVHDSQPNSGPGAAVVDFCGRFPDAYTLTFAPSNCGMTRLWPMPTCN